MQRTILALAALLMLVSVSVSAQVNPVPQRMNFQGRLARPDGTPVADGNYRIRFSLWSAVISGTEKWNQTITPVAVRNGVFAVLLETNSLVSMGGLFNDNLWLEIRVGNDAPLTPRQQLASVAYAMKANSVPDDSITSASIANGTIIAADLAAGTLNTLSWLLGGNSGTNAASNFIGTTDNVDLSLRVNNHRAMRYQYAANTLATNDYRSINVIGGSEINSVGGSVVGATIAGGGWDYFSLTDRPNQVTANFGTIGGGYDNTVSGANSTIGGGSSNAASFVSSTIGGGSNNTSSNSFATIGGGYGNTASEYGTTVGGGFSNTASNTYAIVAGGNNNLASGEYGVISGGRDNITSALYTTIGGGFSNLADTDYATIAGGRNNEAGAAYATVGGGIDNEAVGLETTIGGGYSNRALSDASTIAGGYNNYIIAPYAAIGGGINNTIGDIATSRAAVIAGGESNFAEVDWATVGGGRSNIARGSSATVPGGDDNTAEGDYSFAAGRRARANHIGSFVWGDSNNADVASSANNQFTVRAAGGIRLFTNSALSAGVTLSAGDSSWNVVSDRNAKTNFRPVDVVEVLERLAVMPLTTWNYKTNTDIRHIGVMAQDFHAAFGGLGVDNKHISSVDADGVAFAAIQGLYHKVNEQQKQIDELKAVKAENAALKAQLSELTEIVRQVKTAQDALRTSRVENK